MRDSDRIPEAADVVLFVDRPCSRELAKAQVRGAHLALFLDAAALRRRCDLPKFDYVAIYRRSRRIFMLKHVLRELSGRRQKVTVCYRGENISTTGVLSRLGTQPALPVSGRSSLGVAGHRHRIGKVMPR